MASRIASVPHSTPMPVGPHILWPVKRDEVGAPGRDVGARGGARTGRRRPRRWRRRRGRRRPGGATGVIVPSTFDMAVNDTSFGAVDQAVEVGEVERGRRRRSGSSAARCRRSSASMCHGTMLAWCSSSVSTTGVAGAQVGPSPGLGDQVERLGGVLGEHDLALGAGADEAGDLGPGALERRGGLLGDGVHAAVDVGVGSSRSRSHRVEHLAGLLRRGGRVEVDEALAAAPGGRGSGSPS